MNWIRTVAREILGLFVDDASFAVSIVVWIVFLRIVLPRVPGLARAGGVLLALGLGAILVESTWRYTRRHRP